MLSLTVLQQWIGGDPPNLEQTCRNFQGYSVTATRMNLTAERCDECVLGRIAGDTANAASALGEFP